MGPIFRDRVAQSDFKIDRMNSLESLMGNLVTDAYRKYTAADLSLSTPFMIYDGLPKGTISTADINNALGAVYNPKTGKSWTLKTFQLQGSTLSALIKLMYSFKPIASLGALSTSGMQVTFDHSLMQSQQEAPMQLSESFFSPPNQHISWVQNILIQGKPLDPDRSYKVAASEGVLYCIEFLNSLWSNIVSIDHLQDTHIEDKAIVQSYIRNISSIQSSRISIGDRMKCAGANLSVLPYSIDYKIIRANQQSVQAKIKIKVFNLGAAANAEGASTLRIFGNANRADFSVDPLWVSAGADQAIAPLGPGLSRDYEWNVTLPGERGIFPLRVFISGIPRSTIDMQTGTDTYDRIYYLQH